jgi:hypothetical protein
MSEIKDSKIEVSDQFIDIYTNFNISSQIDKMSLLSERELYLLLVLCLDFHSDEDPVCLNNYKPFTSQIMEINDIQDDIDPSNIILKSLIEETDDKYINADNLVDSKNQSLPKPLEKLEVRNAKIHNILDNPE